MPVLFGASGFPGQGSGVNASDLPEANSLIEALRKLRATEEALQSVTYLVDFRVYMPNGPHLSFHDCEQMRPALLRLVRQRIREKMARAKELGLVVGV